MQNNTLGLIFSGNPEVNLGELTRVRSVAAVPVGGRYRVIDFVLSNMVNSGIVSVGITSTSKNQSLLDHLGTGKDWDMARKDNGLFVLPYIGNDKIDTTNNGIDHIYSAMNYLRRSHQDYVLVSDCDTICNIDYDDVMALHTENCADISVVYCEVGRLTPSELKRQVLLNVGPDGTVSDFQIYPTKQKSNFAYMHMFLIKKSVLMDIVGDCISHDKHSISKDILLKNVKKMKICGYKFDGYRKKIDSIHAYFEFNLDLLKKEIRDELFGTVDDNLIYTKIKDMVPTRYGMNSDVTNSFIADGCRIEGTVKNSILFRGVHIGKGAKVENAIIMQKSEIMDNCTVENAIFDKEVVLRTGKKLVGQETYPVLIAKNTTV